MLPWLKRWRSKPTEHLASAVAYLLLRQLSSEPGSLTGAASHERLKRTFAQLVRKLNPTIFCDIGAHDGQVAAEIHTLCSCAVYAFEANPDVHQHFCKSPKLEGVEYLNLAITDRDGTATMYAPRTLSKAYQAGRVVDTTTVEPVLTGKTSLRRRSEDATYTEFRVAARSLDGFFCSRFGNLEAHRFALWIDVEGAADRVLAGASQV